MYIANVVIQSKFISGIVKVISKIAHNKLVLSYIESTSAKNTYALNLIAPCVIDANTAF